MKRSARHRRNAKALAKTLIATTLTAGTAGAAGAATFNESSLGGQDFEDTLANATLPANLLPVGTDEVTGENQNFGQSEPDFFTFSGLEPNAAFTLNAEWISGTVTNVSVRNSSNGPLDGPELLNFSDSSPTPASLTGLIPGDGMLIFEASGGEGVNYKVTLSAPLLAPVPEPSTLALAALGAALTGVYARRRRKVRGGTTS